MFKRITALFLLSTFIFSAGCDLFNPISPIIQLGVMWMEGEGHKYYNTDQETMHSAVKNVLQDLDFPIIKETNEGDYIYIEASDKETQPGQVALASKFKIKIREVRHNVTKLSIRINTWGDKPYAEMIYRHVDDENDVKDFVTVKELNTAMKVRKRVR